MPEPTLRGETMRLIVSVFVVDAVALGAYLLTDLGTASPRTRLVFGFFWTAATVVVVLAGLRRVRDARLRALRQSR